MRATTAAMMVVALMGPMTTALAESMPRGVRADSRIRTVVYQQDQVFSVLAMMGVSTMIEFNEAERIATVTMGDTVAWQAVPDQSRRFLFIKPVAPNAVTNLNVVTNTSGGPRVYNFILHGAPPGDTRHAVIKLRFTYPEEEADAKLLGAAKHAVQNPNLQAALAHPEFLNYAYGYKGRTEYKPSTVFDDGTKTFFKFDGDIPAIFLVKPDATETLINYRREGEYIVVDKTSGQWTLRNGSVTTCVFNQKAIPKSP